MLGGGSKPIWNYTLVTSFFIKVRSRKFQVVPPCFLTSSLWSILGVWSVQNKDALVSSQVPWYHLPREGRGASWRRRGCLHSSRKPAPARMLHVSTKVNSIIQLQLLCKHLLIFPLFFNCGKIYITSRAFMVAQLIKNPPGLIPVLGRSPGKGIGYPLQYSWTSLVAQMVKNPPTMQETWVPSLSWEDPQEEGMTTLSSILAWRIPVDHRSLAGYGPWSCKELDMTE